MVLTASNTVVGPVTTKSAGGPGTKVTDWMPFSTATVKSAGNVKVAVTSSGRSLVSVAEARPAASAMLDAVAEPLTVRNKARFSVVTTLLKSSYAVAVTPTGVPVATSVPLRSATTMRVVGPGSHVSCTESTANPVPDTSLMVMVVVSAVVLEMK